MVRLSPFKRNDVGSIPTGGTCVTARRLTERPPPYKGCMKVRLLPSRSARKEQRGIKVLAAAHSVLTRASEGSSPSDPTGNQALVVQRRGLRTRNAETWVRVPPGALEIEWSLTIRSGHLHP
jgi:hypothetical protein